MTPAFSNLIGTGTPILTLSDAAQDIYDSVRDLPIVSPHGHCDPRWFAENTPFADPVEVLIHPDQGVLRMLYSQGVSLEDLGVGVAAHQREGRAIFRTFARHFHKFRGTPTDLWMATTLARIFGITAPLNADNADAVYDKIDAEIKSTQMYPHALLASFNIEVLATTDSALDDLAHHKAARKHKLRGKVVPTFCPDAVLDPRRGDFKANVVKLAEITDQDTSSFEGYLEALRDRRAYFMAYGATATVHSLPELGTCYMTERRAATLFAKAMGGKIAPKEAQSLYGHMLTEMAQMSAEDGLVMQIHAGTRVNTNKEMFERFGPNTGADVPQSVNFIDGLDALLNRVGHSRDINIVVFTPDASACERELAPMAGHWPALRLGSPWRFRHGVNGIARYLDHVVESTGYWNLAGFSDNTRAFMSIPARHDLWRRGVSLHLAQQRQRGVLGRGDVDEIAQMLCRDLAIDAYKFSSFV
ncbi:glucuronate isomerase [Shimia marina]|uniref:Uronate isomerase n=1 Tax=Shimia marina TaxID=321267 RepID=A0A0P1EQ68_9RHOB|nr:glucuronate isomerase [Shimia marina]CUH52595.1 Uronate isomerase [Shimia marina]SFE51087.1 glucuronate isomerase [Shimia marina]